MGTKIPWTDETWNFLGGCTAVSEGCLHCAAATSAQLCIRRGNKKYEGLVKDGKWTGEVRLFPNELEKPLHWRKPRMIFPSFMGDLFHESVPTHFILKVLEVTQKCYATFCGEGKCNHIFQFLTKRPKRMAEVIEIWLNDYGYDGIAPYTKNIWLGVTIELPKYKHRAEILSQIPAATRFVSFEPLLGDMGELNLDGIGWVIVGGESGPKARPMHPDWARSIRNQCQAAGVPFFFKQWGEWLSGADKYALGINTYQDYYPKRVTRIENITFFRVGKKKAGHLLDGKEYREYPK